MGPGRGSNTRAEAAGGAEREGARGRPARSARPAAGGRLGRSARELVACAAKSEGEGDKEERECEEKFRKKRKIRVIWTFHLLDNTKPLHQRNR
jgi:hypothetical protein